MEQHNKFSNMWYFRLFCRE